MIRWISWARPRHADHLAADLQADLGHHAQDVAHRRVGVRAQDEIRRRQRVEVGGVAVDVVGVVVHVAELVRERRHLVVEAAVHGLGARHVVAGRAHAADAGDDAGQFLDGPADDELFEAAQLRDLEVAVLDRSGVVQEDRDLPVALPAG